MIVRSGPHNTEDVLRVVKDRLRTQPFEYGIIASKTGEVGLKAVESIGGDIPNLVIVGRSYGHLEPNRPEFSHEIEEKIVALGAKILVGSMIFSGINDSYRNRGMSLAHDMIVAALDIVGVGVTIALESVMRACDASLIPQREDVIGLAGSFDWEGLDTAVIIKSANSNRFLDLKVREILFKPMHW
jgi:hypothetical protein